MLTVDRVNLSGHTNGSVLVVSTSAGSGTLIHAVSTDTDQIDEVWMWASNANSADLLLNIEWGVSTTAKIISMNIPFDSGLHLVIPGISLQGVAGPHNIDAWTTTTGSQVTIYGYVNRMDASP